MAAASGIVKHISCGICVCRSSSEERNHIVCREKMEGVCVIVEKFYEVEIVLYAVVPEHLVRYSTA